MIGRSLMQNGSMCAAFPDVVKSGESCYRVTLDPSWEASVKFNLQLILRHAALVDDFSLPDDAEPAEIFHA